MVDITKVNLEKRKLYFECYFCIISICVVELYLYAINEGERCESK